MYFCCLKQIFAILYKHFFVIFKTGIIIFLFQFDIFIPICYLRFHLLIVILFLLVAGANDTLF